MAITGLLLIAVTADDSKPAGPPVMGHSHQVPDFRGAACIIASILAFIVVGNFLGLLPATFAIVFISAMGDRQNTVKAALVLSAAMMLIATVVFWWALQLQMPLVKWGN